MRVAKVGLFASLVGFGISGILLALGHPGVSLKAVNIVYFLLLTSTLLGLIANEN